MLPENGVEIFLVMLGVLTAHSHLQAQAPLVLDVGQT